MKQAIVILTFILLSNISSLACDCECIDDCSFSVISENSEFVALIKVVSYDDYLERDIMGYEGKMPYSMTVEIIKKYKGTETRDRIKIWGDDGKECRPYIANFEIGEYFIIAPRLLGENRLEKENHTDYDFFSCNTDYLKVDMDEKVAYGEYSKEVDEIKLSDIERRLKE